VGGQNLKLIPGRLYYANYSMVRTVRNDGDTPRIHLVLNLRMNDVLRNVFPKLTVVERVEHFVVRTTLPSWWRLISARRVLANLFSENYDNSLLQRSLHRIRKSSGAGPTADHSG
jgi:hypothetical protein